MIWYDGYRRDPRVLSDSSGVSERNMVTNAVALLERAI